MVEVLAKLRLLEQEETEQVKVKANAANSINFFMGTSFKF